MKQGQVLLMEVFPFLDLVFDVKLLLVVVVVSVVVLRLTLFFWLKLIISPRL